MMDKGVREQSGQPLEGACTRQLLREMSSERVSESGQLRADESGQLRADESGQQQGDESGQLRADEKTFDEIGTLQQLSHEYLF